MTKNYHVNKYKKRFILMLKVNLCDNKNQHEQQKLYDIYSGCSKCLPFAATQALRRLGPMPFLYLLAGWGTSSPCTRDGRPRAADTRDVGFHTSVAVAAQQSGSKSCGLYCMGRAPELWRNCSSALRRSGNA